MSIKIKGRNDFEHVMWRDGGRTGTKLRILCSAHAAPDCEYDGEKILKTPSVTQDAAEHLFMAKGWKIGSDRAHDVCPTCIKWERARRVAEREAKAPEPQAVLPAIVPGEAKGRPYNPTPRDPEGYALNGFGLRWGDSRKADEVDFVLDYLYERMEMREGAWRYRIGGGSTDVLVAKELQKTVPWLNHTKLTYIRQQAFGKSYTQQRGGGRAPDAVKTPMPVPPPPPPPPPARSAPEHAASLTAMMVQAVERPTAAPEAPKPPAIALLERINKMEATIQQQDVLLHKVYERVQELSDDLDDALARLDAYDKLFGGEGQ